MVLCISRHRDKRRLGNSNSRSRFFLFFVASFRAAARRSVTCYIPGTMRPRQTVNTCYIIIFCPSVVSEYLALDQRYDDIKIIGHHHGGDVRHPTAPPIFDPSLRRLACSIAVNYIINTIRVILPSFSYFCRRHLRRPLTQYYLIDNDHDRQLRPPPTTGQ
jgi:hypothetical protein